MQNANRHGVVAVHGRRSMIMRIVRRLTHVLLIVLTLVVGAAAAAIIVSQTAWFRDWMRGYIVREAHQYLNGQLSIERLGGNLFFGVELENIGVSMDGNQVVAVKDLGLDYNIFELISKGLSVDTIRLNKPVIYLRREGDSWSISRLIKKQEQEADRRGPQAPISFDDIGISDGTIVMDRPVGTSGVEVPKRIDHVDAKLNFKYAPVHYSIDITHVSFRGSDPALALTALSGGVSVKDDDLFVEKLSVRTQESSMSFDGAVQNYLTKPVFNLRISSDKLSLPELARIVPAVAGIRLQPAFEMSVSGPMDQLGVDMNVRSSAGQLVGQLTADLAAPGQSIKGDVTVRHLNLAPILDKPAQQSDITGEARVDLRAASFSDVGSLRGTAHVESPRLVAAGYTAERINADATIDGRRLAINGRATAYGGAASAKGNVTLPQGKEPLAYDLTGRAQHVDLRKLPKSIDVPRAATNISADYHATGSVAAGASPSRVAADLKFLDSTVSGGHIAAGSRASVVAGRGPLEYNADMIVSGVDLQRIGNEFGVTALADDRFQSTINGHIVASGEGTRPEAMTLTASGTLHDSSVLGGRLPNLTFDASMAKDTAHVKAQGEAVGFDPGRLSGRPAMKGEAGGMLDVDATFRHVSSGVTPESVDATARVMLEPSTIGGLAIESANIDADYHDSAGVIRTLEVKGRDLNVTASGTLALNDTGQSNLMFHGDTPRLEEVGKLVDLPLKGIATTDGTLTGNRRELQATGSLTGDNVAYGSTSALTMNTKYTVKVPDLAIEQATVSADISATFVTLAGQNINDLQAKTGYANKELTFDATAKQPERTVAAQGAVILHPDHQEVHLQQLGLQTQNLTWGLAPGSQATIRYANDTIAVDHVELASAAQKITADGTFGRPGDALRVSFTNVDMASLDTILLRPPQFTGRLNANATISGSREQPAVNGDFQISMGGFRQFHYDTFSGTAAYSAKGITVDARLQQNPTTWLTAKGYLPMALFGGAAGGHGENVPVEDRIDLHVDSSPIDLGIVQGFTPELTNVTGTVQAKVDVAGSAGDPHATGKVTFQNGAFTVAPTGVPYTGLDGEIDLEADRVHIASIKILDNQNKPLTLTGDLAVHELEVGGVNLSIKTSDFKVIDNKMGNVRVNTDLRLAGELRQPRLEGELGFTTGSINLDPIVEAAGDSAYSTTPIDYQSGPVGPAAQTPPKPPQNVVATAGPTPPKPAPNVAPRAEPPKTNLFESLQMDVHVTVPNDLVVKGQDLQPAGALIGLGSVNVTVGGDLYASKVPYDQLRLTGVVNTVRGFYDFQGRRFDILRDGTVRFEGLDDFDPVLDIRTQRVIQAVTANVAIRGTLKMPEIDLSSTPPLEQADILALIVFNQPINQLGEGQQISVAQRAQALATGAAAGQLGRSIEKALNLDTFEISTPDSGAGAQFTIGQQVGQNLYVKLEQGVGDQSTTNFILEYELARWLRLRTNVLQGSSTQQQLFQRMQGSGADLLFFFSY